MRRAPSCRGRSWRCRSAPAGTGAAPSRRCVRTGRPTNHARTSAGRQQQRRWALVLTASMKALDCWRARRCTCMQAPGYSAAAAPLLHFPHERLGRSRAPCTPRARPMRDSPAAPAALHFARAAHLVARQDLVIEQPVVDVAIQIDVRVPHPATVRPTRGKLAARCCAPFTALSSFCMLLTCDSSQERRRSSFILLATSSHFRTHFCGARSALRTLFCYSITPAHKIAKSAVRSLRASEE